MQNLNNFILENIGVIILVVLALLASSLLFLLFCRDKKGVKDLLSRAGAGFRYILFPHAFFVEKQV